MKKLKLSKKTNILIGLSVLVFVASIIIVLSSSTTAPTSPQTSNQQPTTYNHGVTTLIETPNQFIWQIDKLELPETISVYKTTSNSKTENILNNLALALGFNGQPTKITNTPIVVYNNPAESTSIHLNRDENFIQFSLDLLTKSPQEAQYQPEPLTKINQDTLALLTNNLQLPTSLSITKNSTHYQTTNGPRFVTTTQDKAKYVKSTYNYSLNSLPIFYPEGNSIETIHTLSGKPVKLTIALPPSSLQKLANHQVKTLEEIKSTPQDQFITILLEGNEDFTISDQELDLDTAILTSGFLGYINNQDTNILEPFIFLTGTVDNTQYGQLEIMLAIHASK